MMTTSQNSLTQLIEIHVNDEHRLSLREDTLQWIDKKSLRQFETPRNTTFSEALSVKLLPENEEPDAAQEKVMKEFENKLFDDTEMMASSEILIEKTIRRYDKKDDAKSSTVTQSKRTNTVSLQAGTRLRSSVGFDEKTEFMEVYKQAVSKKNSLRESVSTRKSLDEKRKSLEDEAKITGQKQGRKSSDAGKQSKPKLDMRKFSKTSQDQESTTDDKKVRVQETMSSTITPSKATMSSTLHLETPISKLPLTSRRDTFIKTNISLDSSVRRVSKPSNAILKALREMKSIESSIRDSREDLLPHLENIADDRVLRSSIDELNKLVEIGKEEFRKSTLSKFDEDDENSEKMISSIAIPAKISSVSFQNIEEDILKPERELEVFEAHQEQIEQVVLHDPVEPLGQGIKAPETSTESFRSQKSVDATSEIGWEYSNEEEELESYGMEDSINSSDVDEVWDRDRFIYKFKGDKDANGLRTNFGCLKWISAEKRKYCGYFQYNSLHGEGYYFIKGEKYLNFYDGKLYNNELHGYGQIMYGNGDKYEGLFRQNYRFGPGVLSHMDGTQNVGIWYGNSILRLTTCISYAIPLLGKSTLGKLKLLEHKRIIPVNTTYDEVAVMVLDELDANLDIYLRFKELYNPHVRNKNSLFFDRSRYDLSYFGQEDCYIDVVDNNKLPDFILIKKELSNEKLNEKSSAEARHSKRTYEELIHLKKKIIDIKDNCQCTTDNQCNDDNYIASLVQKELFFNNVLDFIDVKLSRHVRYSEDKNTLETKKILVDSILALNNGDVLVDVLRHSFICRKSEVNVSFDVRNVLIGKRDVFGLLGQHEQCCVDFLERCGTFDEPGALKFLVNGNVNPNVCDSRGNTGLHLATWNHDKKVIRMLANHGANMECVNDEGVNPLNLCLLQYLEAVYSVVNWETSFLDLSSFTLDIDYITRWRPQESFINLNQSNIRRSSTMTTSSSRKLRSCLKKKLSTNTTNSLSFDSNRKFSHSPDRFVFSLRYVSWPKRFSVEPKGINIGEDLTRFSDNMKRCLKILKTLVRYGADPNKQAVPYPPFFLALFTKTPEIVELFLEAKADKNSNLEGMTPLQIVSCLELCEENCKIMELLIDHSACLNLLSDTSIWQECDKYLLGDLDPGCEIVKRGKDALHFICLREDFSSVNSHLLCRMAEMLIHAGIRTIGLYLGHSHLSMAIVKGNVSLVECLLSFLDPARPLGYGLGNALTVLALARYSNYLPFFICKKIVDLILPRVSPFNPLYCYFNIFEYLDVDAPCQFSDDKRGWDGFMHRMKTIRAYISNSKSLQDTDNCSNDFVKVYLQEKSREILHVVNRYKAVFYLYCFMRLRALNTYTSYLAKLIGNSDEFLTYIRYTFNSGKMPRCFLSLLYIAGLMKYVDNVNKVKKKVAKGNTEGSKESHPVSSDTDTTLLPEEISMTSGKSQASDEYQLGDYLKELDLASFDECENAGPPHIDRWTTEENLTLSNICFFCMQRTGKTLLRCPNCGIVRFCSNRCDYLSAKLKVFHPCPGKFYGTIYKENKKLIEENKPVPIYGIDLEFERLRNDYLMRLCSKSSKMKHGERRKSTVRCSIRLRAGTNLIQDEKLSKPSLPSNSPNQTEGNADGTTKSNSYFNYVTQRRVKFTPRLGLDFIEDVLTRQQDMGVIENLNDTGMNSSEVEQVIEVIKPDGYRFHSRIKLHEHVERDCSDNNEEILFPPISDEKKQYCSTNKKRRADKTSDSTRKKVIFPIIESYNWNTNIVRDADGHCDKAFKNELNLLIEKRTSNVQNSLNAENKKIDLGMYQDFFRKYKNLDVESVFLPYTCYSGEKMFHKTPDKTCYFYEPSDVPIRL
ncbi:uncharacterized protein LOC123681766 [Harmonia axyridis]|uniref:uncharacterized protein LOC123681766 n=1 Tax=Harmonia axyridis TaxID=115357 RepID=UPI001E275834|nr:uncharacterized protein LOC123681766 [Harmonia axyridis]